MFVRLAIALWLLLYYYTACADVIIGDQLIANTLANNRESIFNISDKPDRFSHNQFNEIYARLQHKGFNLLAVYDVDRNNKQQIDGDGSLKEAYYDFSAKDVDFTLGKKVLSWGVGYAYRPLDLIQQQNRRLLVTQNLKGVNIGSASFYTGSTAITLLITNQTILAQQDYQADKYEEAIKIYSLLGDWDLHGVVHYSEDYGASIGAGFSTVVGEGLELHASSIYRSRYSRYINTLVETNQTLATADPIIKKKYNDCVNAVIGFTWTSHSRITIIGEAWHDGTAHTYDEWAAMRDLTRRQQQLLNISPLPAPRENIEAQITGNQRYFSGVNLLQNNLFARLSYDGEKTDPYIDALLTPDDGGMVLTAAVEHKMRQNILMYTGIRYFTGKSGSVFRELVDQATIYYGFRAEFVL
ncbi:MAG: hypothetical protein R3240_01835 [Gammaproteobacteria bacterium]|nr:hypothetical protein [Gammaproteobacteria bacterium]